MKYLSQLQKKQATAIILQNDSQSGSQASDLHFWEVMMLEVTSTPRSISADLHSHWLYRLGKIEVDKICRSLLLSSLFHKKMLKMLARANKSKRLRTEVNRTEEESSFADISIPLTLSSLPENIPLGDSLPSPSSLNEESQSGDECNHHIWELHFPGKSCNVKDLALDLMWIEVCDTLIAQTDERELRDWER